MDIAHLILLAVIQGITEFLPISSSAHVVLAGYLMTDMHSIAIINIALHGATLAALIVHFFGDIKGLVRSARRGHGEGRVYLQSLCIATVPVFIVGAFAYQFITDISNPTVIAIILIASGLFLFGVDRYAITVSQKDRSVLVKGFWIGLMQIFSLVPGVSRSGITMTAGRLVGFSRRQAVRFSFFLAMPVILGAVVWSLAVVVSSPAESISVNPVHLAGAAVITFFLALGTIRWLLNAIERVGFTPFCIYQVLLGSAVLFVTF